MYCISCGALLDDGTSRCPHCGSSLAASQQLIGDAARVGRLLTLPEAIATVLEECPQGCELLSQPNRLLGNIMDITDNSSPSIRILISNCDNELMRVFYKAAQAGTLDDLEYASSRAAVMLAEQRYIVESAAKRVCKEISQGIGAYLDLCTVEAGEEISNYDVFVCCKENEDATGAITQDRQLAAQLANELASMGCSVFYPRLSLRDLHLSMHESLTQSALEGSLVFVALGTTKPHLNCEWVKSCGNVFFSHHPRSSKNAMVVYSTMHGHDIPNWLGGISASSIDGEDSVVHTAHAIARRARSLRYGQSNSAPNTKYRYEIRTLVRNGLQTEAVQIESLEGPSIFVVRYSSANKSGFKRVKTCAIDKGHRALVLMGPNARVKSIEPFQTYSREILGNWLVWYIKSFMGRRLTIGIVNKSIYPTRLKSFDLIAYGAVDSITALVMRNERTLHAYERCELEFDLEGKEVDAVKRAGDYDLVATPYYAVIPRME